MNKKDLNFEIGLLIGREIIRDFLPSLSTDSLRTSNIIEVPKGLSSEWTERNKAWIKSLGTGKTNDKLFYENREWYRKNIEDVYLEEELKIHIGFNYTDEKAVMEGIENSLWDSDLSHYKIKSLEKHKYTNEIILKRHRE